jgi:hypothetical protein
MRLRTLTLDAVPGVQGHRSRIGSLHRPDLTPATAAGRTPCTRTNSARGTPGMQLVARTFRYLANRYLADPHVSNQFIARANAAEASASLRSRRQAQADVDAYLREQRKAHLGADEIGARQG